MAEARLRWISLVAWVTLAIGAVAFSYAGLTSDGVDSTMWIVESSIWFIAITGISLVTVPAPSGTRLSLGIGAIVAASLLVVDTTAFSAAVCGSLVVSWILQSRMKAFAGRTDGDFLGDTSLLPDAGGQRRCQGRSHRPRR